MKIWNWWLCLIGSKNCKENKPNRVESTIAGLDALVVDLDDLPDLIDGEEECHGDLFEAIPTEEWEAANPADIDDIMKVQTTELDGMPDISETVSPTPSGRARETEVESLPVENSSGSIESPSYTPPPAPEPSYSAPSYDSSSSSSSSSGGSDD